MPVSQDARVAIPLLQCRRSCGELVVVQVFAVVTFVQHVLREGEVQHLASARGSTLAFNHRCDKARARLVADDCASDAQCYDLALYLDDLYARVAIDGFVEHAHVYAGTDASPVADACHIWVVTDASRAVVCGLGANRGIIVVPQGRVAGDGVGNGSGVVRCGRRLRSLRGHDLGLVLGLYGGLLRLCVHLIGLRRNGSGRFGLRCVLARCGALFSCNARLGRLGVLCGLTGLGVI